MIKVIFEKDEKQFPIKVNLGRGAQHMTETAAKELLKKLQCAIRECEDSKRMPTPCSWNQA